MRPSTPLFSALLALALCAPAAAQDAAPLAGTAAELARINATLERIADALVQQTKLDILARRIQLAGTRIADAEKRMAAARDEQTKLEEEEQRLAGMRESIEAAAGSDATPAHEREIAVRQIDAEHAWITGRLRALTSQVLELENGLARQRTDLDEWQAYLDRLVAAL